MAAIKVMEINKIYVREVKSKRKFLRKPFILCFGCIPFLRILYTDVLEKKTDLLSQLKIK